MEEKELLKLAQISEISKALEKHLELFEGDTNQLGGALSMALNKAMESKSGELSGLKKNAVVRVTFF